MAEDYGAHGRVDKKPVRQCLVTRAINKGYHKSKDCSYECDKATDHIEASNGNICPGSRHDDLN